MLNNAPIDDISARMVTVTKGMRILQRKLHELWERYGLDRELVNIIIRFLDLPVRVFRQLEFNPRYGMGGIVNQMTDFPLASHYYRKGYHYLYLTNRNHLSLHQQRLDGVI